MTEKDKPMFVAALTELAALKPGAKLTPEAYAAWWNAMQSWSLDDFRQACSKLRGDMEFMPNPYHFEKLRKASLPTAGEAWADVLAIARHDLAAHEDPRVNLAVRAIGGYHAIAMSRTDQTQFLEKRFAEHYESITDAEDVREAVPNLTGPPRFNGRSRSPNYFRAESNLPRRASS